MQYPLTLSFKIIALAPQIYVRDASGRELLYVKQKLLKLKEKIRVFADSSQSRELYEINADRILDIAARYSFTDASGQGVGSVKRQGLRSFWKATYEVADASGRTIFLIEEENPWVKVLDGLLGEIPILGIFAGYFLHPRYNVKRADRGTLAFRVSKHRSFLESTFEIEELERSAGEAEEIPLVLSILMMTLLERQRG
jgi:uncharacterized protein YxjI